MYDAGTKRFLSADPIDGSVLKPVLFNPYLYCASDPVNNIDPTGMWMPGDENITDENKLAALAYATAEWEAASAKNDQAGMDAAHAAAQAIRYGAQASIAGITPPAGTPYYTNPPGAYKILFDALTVGYSGLSEAQVHAKAESWGNAVGILRPAVSEATKVTKPEANSPTSNIPKSIIELGLSWVAEELMEALRLLSIVVNFNVPNIVQIIYNYVNNRDYTFTGYINGQGVGDAAKMRMGVATADHNGCGWIATYNAFVALGSPMDPALIISVLELNGGTIAFGALGVNAVAIRDIFVSLGYKTDMMTPLSSLDDRIKASKVAILEYAHSQGAHYVAIEYKNGMFYVYNENNSKTTETPVASIDVWLPTQGIAAVSLITIS